MRRGRRGFPLVRSTPVDRPRVTGPVTGLRVLVGTHGAGAPDILKT